MDDFASTRISHDDSREIDENDQMFSKNQNLKKPPMKHFMAPTISATSKAAIPRKKILTERNETSDSTEAHQQNTPKIVPKTSQVHLHNGSGRSFSRKTASGIKSYESDDDEHNDATSKPYDPLTNYLSPRPKFLRYNPNRRRETYNRRDGDTEVQGSYDRSSSVSSSLKSSKEIQNEEIDIVNKDDDDHGLEDDDEEIEVFEKESGLSLTGIFKFLFVYAVLFLLTWYISCMNTWEPLPIRESTNGYINGYNSTYGIVDVSNTWEELVNPIDGKQKVINEFSGHVSKEEMEVRLKLNEKGVELEPKEDGLVVYIEPENIERAKKPKPFQNDQIPIASDLVSVYVFENGEYHKQEAVSSESIYHDKGDEMAETRDKPEDSDLVDTVVTENEERGNSVSLDREGGETENINGISAEGDGRVEETRMESENNAEEGMSLEFSSTKESKSKLIYGAFIGLFVIIASSLLAFYLKCKRNPIEKSRSIDKPLYNTIPTENISSENQMLLNLEEAHIKEVESYVNPSMYVPLVEENVRDDYPLTRAPTVELLGEFIVGEVRSSMKSCNSKSKTKETEVKLKEMESQGDTNSVFLDNVVKSKGNLSTPQFSASTAKDSPSYGSVTDKKKIVKKEEGSAMTTPIRRSSRIRNRALSP